MNRLRFIFISVVALLSIGHAAAYDFESGGLYYNILDAEAKTVELTCRNYTDWSTRSDYTGDIVVPATVDNGGITYSVKQIGRCAFKSSEITSLTLSEGIEVIEQDICEGCNMLTSLSLPSTLKSIGYAAFWSCNGLTSVDLPEGLTELGNQVFAYCDGLKRVDLPSTLTQIGERIFDGTNSLTAVVSRITQPFATNKAAFAYESRWNGDVQEITPLSATLYVPDGTLDKYKSTTGWSLFANIVEGEPKEATVDGVRYSYSQGGDVASVIAGDYASLENVTIPATVTIDGSVYHVKSISSGAFYQCSSLRSLTIENGVEVIGNKAFQFCSNLESITLPEILKSIGECAFSDTGIRAVVIPEGVTTIGTYAFSSCFSLTKVVLPSTVTSIGYWAFGWCQSLSAVVSHIQAPFEIDKSVFSPRSDGYYDAEGQWVSTYTPSPATLYVPDGTKTAYEALEGWNMFAGIIEGEAKEATVDGLTYLYLDGKGTATLIKGDYSDLSSVTIPSSVTIEGASYDVNEIAAGAFAQCSSLTSLVIEGGVKKIGANAFENCYNLSEINLPEGLEEIGEKAFYWTNAQTVILPSTLKSIGERAFYHLSNNVVVKSRIKEPFAIPLSTFAYDSYWENEHDVYTHLQGTLHVPVGTVAQYQALDGWMVIGELFEGEPKEGVGDDGFKYSYVPETQKATLIRGDDYYALNNVSIPATATIDGVTCQVIGIGDNAFSNTYLNSVKITEGVKTIGKHAFSSCNSLTSVSMPSSITKIGNMAFAWCERLDTIAVPSQVVSIGDEAFIGCGIQDIVIPSTTTSIGYNVFGDCRKVKSIRVDAGNSAYDSRNNCNALIETATNKLLKATATTIIPNSIVEIGNSAFGGLSSITSITIPNSVTTIQSSAFNDCDGLTSIYIPSSVTTINPNPFTNCDLLASIKVDEHNPKYDSRNNCNAIIEKATHTLVSGCKNTVIPRGVKIIANSALNCVRGLDSLKIPNGVEEIQNFAISYSSIRYLEIPNSVKNIDWYALAGNYNLATIVSKIKDPTKINVSYSAFYDSQVASSALLYVPKGTKALYQQDESGFSHFYNIIEMDGAQLATPTLQYDGRYVTATSTEEDVDMYYGIGGAEPTEYYDGPISVSDLGTVKVIAEKSFRSDSEPATYDVRYLYNGDTLKLAEAGLMAEAIKWCGTDSVVKMTVVGPINTDEFSTIRTLPNLKFLNLAAAQVDGASLPDGAFANSQLVSFVSPNSLSSVGSGIFRNCPQLAAVCWNASTALPSDALSGVSNPNLLLYVSSESQAPAGINNVVVNGVAKSITLTDAVGNSNFYVPVAFQVSDTIKYTRNFQQKTEVGVSCGWETIVLPFDVRNITHEDLDKGFTITPFANYTGNDNQRPFWLYTLDENDIRPAYKIEANVPYLICMPNADEYGDQYNLAGNVTFIATNVDIAVSKPIEKTQGELSFVPTYQSVPASAEVFTLNVNEEYKGYPAGSLFVSNFRDVRPFEAYSIHPSGVSAKAAAAASMFTVGSLIGGNDSVTGIIDVMLKKNDGTGNDAVVKVYSLSGSLVKQGRAEDVAKGLAKGVYIANGKKFVVK